MGIEWFRAEPPGIGPSPAIPATLSYKRVGKSRRIPGPLGLMVGRR